MIRVGVVGLGMMGQTHLASFAGRPDARVVAVADRNADKRRGANRPAGNIPGQPGGGVDLSSVKQYADPGRLIDDPEIELVDICLPTPAHLECAMRAMAAGTHVLIEKPLARTYEDALRLAEAAEQAPGQVMVAMCMRFWPGWDWLKSTVERQTYGKALSASFARLAQHPGGKFYGDGEASGGALLDFHLHDADFVRYCFGEPTAVFSTAHTHLTGAPDHVVTQYLYPDGPVVSAEGGWSMAPGYGFSMRYTVNFEHATADFELGRTPALRVTHGGQEPRALDLPGWMGYDAEIGYFIDCITTGSPPQRVTVADAAESIRLIEAEGRSIAAGVPVELAAAGR
ncbi:MAG: Gfo/Idh/MocA family oxidoreductase [Planctomycetota bacterium]